jgi:glycosyltransferase involved in cell wall biosynthesis
MPPQLRVAPGARGLAKLSGDPVAVIAFDARDAFAPMPHGSGIYVRHLLAALERRRSEHELWVLTQGGRGPELWWEQATFPRLLRSRRAALVHSPDSFLPLRRSCPGVVTIHDLGFETIAGEMPARTAWKYKTFVPRSARSAQRVICPSRFTAEDVAERYGIPVEKIRVIAEAPALPEGSLPAPEGPYLLAVGDLRPKKNLATLVEAWRRLREADVPLRLVLAGADFGLASSLRSLAAGAPLEVLGFVDDAQLDALIRGAEALVVPSLYEGFGLVVLEAMVRGCPAVLARAGALPETGGDAAAYFDPSDPADLAAVLRRVVGDPAERARLGAAGRAHAERFSWDRAAAETFAVYEELLA